MSYILEAIQKADQKRKLGSVPDVHTVHEGPSPVAKRLIWPYVLAAGLFLNAVLIVLWLQPWSSKVPAVTRTKVQAIAEQTRASDKPLSKASVSQEITEPKVTITKEAAPVLPAETTIKAGKAVSKPVIAVDDQPPSPRAETAAVNDELSDAEKGAKPVDEPATSGKSVVDDRGPDAEGGEPHHDNLDGGVNAGTEQPQQPQQPQQIVERIGGKSLPDTDYTESDLLAEQQRKIEAQELKKIPNLSQMPPDFRKDIPEIHISFHSYSYKPAKCLVSINGRIFREGDDISDGIKLEKITPVGVVLSHEGRRFKVAI